MEDEMRKIEEKMEKLGMDPKSKVFRVLAHQYAEMLARRVRDRKG